MGDSQGRSPLITIAMPTSNSAWALPRVLESILQFDYDLKRVRLVFVDNNSGDGTESLLKDFSIRSGSRFESMIIEKENSNIPVARNICFEKAVGSDYVFILDSDVVAPPDTLKTLLHDFDTFQNVGMASFPWDDVNAKERARSLYNAFETSSVQANAYKVGNGCSLLSMNAIKVVGNFNPRLSVHEDGEYCYRLKRHGFDIICDFTHQGIHLKKVPTPPKFYLKFIWNSSNTYIEMLKLGSLMHILKFLTTIVAILCLVLLVILREVLPLYAFVGTLLLAFWVNTNRRILDDGIHVKLSYLPILAPVMTALTAAVVVASLGRIMSRGILSVFRLGSARKGLKLDDRFSVKATSSK